METDPNILVIARAAVVEFGVNAADIMDGRARSHDMAGEDEGSELWRRIAAAVRENIRRLS